LLSSCNSRIDVPSQQKLESGVNTIQYQKELDEIKESIKSETKIKVKKDTKGYSWEITGKDPQQILKANDALRKRLGD
jgi:hypothetical protein